MEWPGSLDEYQKLVSKMNTPRVVIDNNVCPDATVVKVDSARKHGVLLEAVQALSDLNLSITKAYISSDGRWFMDVFHVTDHLGDKLEDDQLLSLIQHSLTAAAAAIPSSSPHLTAIELTADDRPGLLSELFAVLGDLQCAISAAKLWTLNSRMASLLFLHDIDSINVNLIENRLRHVLNGDAAVVRPSTTSLSHADRRLHQLIPVDGPSSTSTPPSISIQNLVKRDYSVINIHCHDRPKLLFDVVCALTDMDYIVFHGTVHTDHHHNQAHQEFYVRRSDGTAIRTEEEKQKVVQCLQAAIERRSEKGVRLELCAEDRGGLLAGVTRVLRENGLAITNAEVGVEEDGMVRSVFYVSDVAGCRVDEKAIDAVKERINGSGSTLKVGEEVRPPPLMVESGVGVGGLVYLGSLVRRNLYNLGLIRSCS